MQYKIKLELKRIKPGISTNFNADFSAQLKNCIFALQIKITMINKRVNAEVSTITRDIASLEKETGNAYETIAIIAKRANQISVQMKEELSSKLAEFATHSDNLEEVFENREQIEISKHYEKMPKPASVAIQEYMEGKIYFRKPEEIKK